MELSLSLGYLLSMYGSDRLRSLEDAACLCKGAGFDFVDYSPICQGDAWEADVCREREILERAGLAVEQTHAPFNRYGFYSAEEFPERFRRLFVASRILGAKAVVVHADEYRPIGRYDVREALTFTYEFLAPYVEYAAKHDLIVAVENLCEDFYPAYPQIDGKSRFTSRLEELLGVIERFHSPAVGCCWDFGHANLAFGREGMDAALAQALPYVCCTHVHDNYQGRDLHLPPFFGEIDWARQMALLKQGGYAGKLSFEMVYGVFPETLLPMWLQNLCATGEALKAMFAGA